MSEMLILGGGYPGVPLVIAGSLLAIRGIWRGAREGRRLRVDPMRALAILSGFRSAVIGLALCGVGAAWIWQCGWLLALSLIIGGQELLESSIMIAAARQGCRSTSACNAPSLPRGGTPPLHPSSGADKAAPSTGHRAWRAKLRRCRGGGCRPVRAPFSPADKAVSAME